MILAEREKKCHMKDMRTRQEKARQLRWKHGALESMGSAWLMSRLDEIEEACSDVQYFADSDEETLLNALDGNEDELWEFKMLFSDLSADATRLRWAVNDWRFDSEDYDDSILGLAGLSDRTYDDVTVALMGGSYEVFGYDSYERDYFHLLSPYAQEWAQDESMKRLMAKTKKELLECIKRSWGVFLAFFDLDQRYEHLKATMDILRGDNTALLNAIRRIEKLYEEAIKRGGYSTEFDQLLTELPDRVWVE